MAPAPARALALAPAWFRVAPERRQKLRHLVISLICAAEEGPLEQRAGFAPVAASRKGLGDPRGQSV